MLSLVRSEITVNTADCK